LPTASDSRDTESGASAVEEMSLSDDSEASYDVDNETNGEAPDASDGHSA